MREPGCPAVKTTLPHLRSRRQLARSSMQSIPDSLDDAQPSGPPEVRMFWTGPPLSPYELLSLQSFVAAGARVFVYSTSRTLRVPEGVELLDARGALAWTGAPVFLSGWAILRRRFIPIWCATPRLHRFGGWYADLDMICLRGLPTSKVYLAWQSDDSVNGAIMKFPPHSPVMAGAIEESRARAAANRARRAHRPRALLLGPHLVTKLVHDYALDHVVRPTSSAYPIELLDTPAMFDPQRRDELDERIADSDFVHLWNEYWRRVRIPKELGPPRGQLSRRIVCKVWILVRRRGAAVGRRGRGLVRGNPVS